MTTRTWLVRAATAILAAVLAACSGGRTASTGASPGPNQPSAAPSAVPSIAAPRSQELLGAWIAYNSGQGIDRVQPDGTHHSVLINSRDVPSPSHGDWAPDGRLAFQAGDEGSWDIWIAEVDGANPRILVDCHSPCINMDAPAWSPDGTLIAFSRLDEVGDDLPNELQIANPATGAVITVATLQTGDYVTSPRWSPDGHSLVVSYEDHHGPKGTIVEKPIDSRIAVIKVDDAKPTFRFLTPKGMEASYPDWSPTGDRIVFQAGPKVWWDEIAESGGNIFSVDADGSDLRQLTTFGPSDRVVWLPTWTEDGASILVTLTVRATRENSIGEMAADGSDLADLPGPVGGAHPRMQRTEGAP